MRSHHLSLRAVVGLGFGLLLLAAHRDLKARNQLSIRKSYAISVYNDRAGLDAGMPQSVYHETRPESEENL